MDVEKKKRTSRKQFEIYVKYLNNCELLRTGKLKPSENPKMLENIWEMLSVELNSCGDGPIRNIQDWKKVFREWKFAVRKKARGNKELTSLERELLELTGIITVTGFTNNELGLQHENVTFISNKEVDVDVDTQIENDIVFEKNIPDGKTDTECEESQCVDGSETLILQIEDNGDIPTNTPRNRTRKKKMENPLLSAYKEGQQAELNGLSNIADALENIARESNKKTNSEQYKVYLLYLEKYKFEKKIPQHEFVMMCKELNSMKGAVKNEKQWQQTFQEWGCKVKKKAREIFRHQQQTGGGPALNMYLTDLENWLLSILNIIIFVIIMITGMNIAELGLQKKKYSTNLLKPTYTTNNTRKKFRIRKRMTKTQRDILTLFITHHKLRVASFAKLILSITKLLNSWFQFVQLYSKIKEI